MRLLSRNEEIVLMAVWKLMGNAYGVTIKELVSDLTGYIWKFGAVYVALDKLTLKGFVWKYNSAPVPERGGRSKVMYEVTSTGKLALKEIRQVNTALWDGISDVAFD
ncbi:PadR family transcriptional regulator [candidate division KSB1 bacterium]